MDIKDYQKLSREYHCGKISAKQVIEKLLKQNDFDYKRVEIKNRVKRIK